MWNENPVVMDTSLISNTDTPKTLRVPPEISNLNILIRLEFYTYQNFSETANNNDKKKVPFIELHEGSQFPIRLPRKCRKPTHTQHPNTHSTEPSSLTPSKQHPFSIIKQRIETTKPKPREPKCTEGQSMVGFWLHFHVSPPYEHALGLHIEVMGHFQQISKPFFCLLFLSFLPFSWSKASKRSSDQAPT